MEVIPLAIMAGVSAYQGVQQSKAAKSASNQQAGGQQAALNFTQGVYDDSTKRLQPFTDAGAAALPSLLSFFGLPGGSGNATDAYKAFQATPSYQFPLQQGQLALQRQLSSVGLLDSPGALREGLQLNQGYASQNLQSWLQGLSGIAGMGQGAAAALGQQGLAAGQQVLAGQTGLGNAQAAGTVGASNAIYGPQGAISNAMGPLMAPPNQSGQSNLPGWYQAMSKSSFFNPANTNTAPSIGGVGAGYGGGNFRVAG